VLPGTRRELTLVALVLFGVAAVMGSLGLAGHDHDPSDVCRICPTVHSVDTVDVAAVRLSPELRGVSALATVAEIPSSVDLLLTSPVRGPPA